MKHRIHTTAAKHTLSAQAVDTLRVSKAGYEGFRPLAVSAPKNEGFGGN